MALAPATPVADDGSATAFGSIGYRTYVLISLTLVYTLNFIDRTVITVVAQPIINTFNLTDGQWGLLTGPPFAIFYAVMGIPIAMWADRGNRVFIISLCIIIWSLMTVFCGLAASFIWLLVFRIGVAIGEAGCTPPANSLITDYYPPRSRASAIGIYGMGVTLGGLLAQLFGGAIASLKGADVGNFVNSIGLGGLFSGVNWAEVEGWRLAFVIVGAPGILVALIVLFTMREPPRGHSEPAGYVRPAQAGLLQAFQEFASKPTFWTLSLGAAFVAFVGYGLISFQAPFLMRVHGVSVHEAAINYGAPLAAVAALGTFLGGWLTQQLTPRYGAAAAWIPAVSLLIAIPAYVLAFMAKDLSTAFVFWIIAAIAHYGYLSAQYIVTTSIVSPSARATTVSVMLLIVSLIGNGIGPLFTGMMSTHFMKSMITKAGLADQIAAFDPKLCAGKVAELGAAGPQLCSAYSEGLRQSMVATVLFFVLAALFYFLASRTYIKDKYRAA